jgi:hypothetical protein
MELHFMQRVFLIILLNLAISACASTRQETACYRVVESVVTENGSRALMQVPCPPGRQGVLTDEG